MENQTNSAVQPSRKAKFWFNALVGIAFIVSASMFTVLGLIGIISIFCAPQGFALLACAAGLYACGARLLLGAFLDE